jgi:tripartite-type tricarboxylate transporter receptor subunit TctC
MTRLALLLAAVLAVACVERAAAQTYPANYPTKPIKLIVPFGPGGPTDLAARLASQILQAELGQSVVIENRPGAGGATGTRAVAAADPDGYTLLLGTVATLGALPAAIKDPGFDPNLSFAPIAKLTESAAILAVPNSLPVNTVGELIAYAKASWR